MRISFFQRWTRIFIALGFFSTLLAFANPKVHEIKSVRVWPAPDKTRVVLDWQASLSYQLAVFHAPERVVIDISNARLPSLIQNIKFESSVLEHIRHTVDKQNKARIVFALKKPATVRSFVLPPNQLYRHRLVVDLYESGAVPSQKVVEKRLPTGRVQTMKRAIVVAIDAGHGGDDPGAIGQKGTHEKHVTLTIARQLAKLIEKEPGLHPFLTRKGDYFVGLKERTLLARKAEADFFVSVHADSYRSPTLKGSSVYVLSDRRASSEAGRWLAERENLSDLLGGIEKINGEGGSNELASFLFDLLQSKTRRNSFTAGKLVLNSLRKVNTLHRSTVQKAGFVVLRAPDIPSILVETAFLSNLTEEQKLAQKNFQQQLSRAIFSGIQNYFVHHPPEGVTYASSSL
ncbi:MAG: N-acetylmuramoyl-L-alanine amidase [Gammaproteobacteria bacterium]|nr:N-acetylmuramoyl-L-alanine amidase [Gammaproteobacteria bacterium]